MLESLATVDVPLTVEQALHLNEACDRFEAAWKATEAGEPGPRIEDYAAGAPDPERILLLRHLVLLDVDYRRLRGEQPEAPEYSSRFPLLSGRALAEALASPSRAEPAADKAELPDGMFKAETTVLPPPFKPQLRSNRYVIQQFHARGGIGEIWLAQDAEIGRQVALKRLRQKREEQQDRFLVEAQITGQLEHPGIVPVHDLGVDEEGRPFYVMSFIHGRTLKEAIDEYHAAGLGSGESREVQFSRLLEIFVKVCQAVAYAHHRGVVHRDLKPDNVMLGPFGEALVLDWGMAKVRDQPESTGGAPPVQPTYSGGSTATEAGMVMGSPAYMAPEAAEGRAVDADERTDVYLLGATLYHILTGQAPRQGSSREEIVELARTVPPPPPRRLKPDVPRALEAVCQKAMAHRQQDRYASALELAREMERYLAGAPVSAYREPLLSRTWRWCKRHRRGLARSLAAALVLALALVGGVLVRDVWNESARLRSESEKLRRSQQAREDLGRFFHLSEAFRFHRALTTPAGESAAYYDPRRGQKAGQDAIDLADRLSGELQELGLESERAGLEGGLHDLLLLTAQSQQALDRTTTPAVLERLERAAALRGPTRGYHHLRARCYRAQGEPGRADDEERRASTVAATALDHFLEAEDYRARAGAPAETSGDTLAWQPNPELLRKAIAHYRQALRIEPNNFWCYLQMGRCYLTLREGPEAIEALGTCVALRPKEAWGYSARGLALGLVQLYADGEADLDRALEIDPEFLPARLHRGVLAWLQRQDDRALAEFAKVLDAEEDRRLIEAAYYRGQLRLQRKEHAEALGDFDRVAKENPGFRPLYLSRSQVHFLRGDDTRGLADLATFLDLGRPKPFDPKDPNLFAQRGRLLRRLVPNWGLSEDEYLAKLRLAWDELETAQRLGLRSAELFEELGSVAHLRNEPDRALAAYAKALEKATPDLAAKVRTRRGWVYVLNLGQYDKARDEFTAALRLDPGYADAHSGWGYILALQKSSHEAQHEAARALGHGADDYLILHNVACIYAVLAQVEKGQAKPHEDMALALLRRAREQWEEQRRRGGDGPSELEAIRSDPALKGLSQSRRAEFEKLLVK
jgi:serine/threonine protein kinase/Flp pilus assembly protein TadD